MALPKEVKKHLDSLSDNELYAEFAIRFGQFIPVWEEVSKDEYEENYGKEDDYSWKAVEKWLSSPYTYKREPHWKNVQPGILWQIEHYHDEPDYYTYHKLVKREFTLMLGSDTIDYLHNRKPSWYLDMTQKDKELLLKDLCARLPYGVKVQGNFKWGFDGQIMDDIRESVLDIETLEWLMNGIEVRPYLRPMSSMTEKEMEKYKTISIWGWVRESKIGMTDICPTIEGYDWLNAHHFDYRGLIPKDLAIEVTEENNPYKD